MVVGSQIEIGLAFAAIPWEDIDSAGIDTEWQVLTNQIAKDRR